MPIRIKEGSVTVSIYPTHASVRGKKYKVFSVRWHNPIPRSQANPELSKMVPTRKNFSKRGDAVTFARAKAIQLANGQGAALALSEAAAAMYVAACERLAGTGKTLLAAIEEYVEAARIAPVLAAARFHAKHHAGGPRLTFPEAVAKFIEAKSRDGTRWRHLRDLKSRLNLLAEVVLVPLVHLTTRDIVAVLDSQQRKGEWTNRTRNHYRAALTNLETFSIAQGYVARDWDEFTHIPRVKERDGQVTVYIPEQLTQLLAHTNDCHIPAVCVMFFAGIRHNEVTGDAKDGLRPLDWSDINFRTGQVFIAEGKVRTAGQRFAQLSANGLAWLRPLRKESGPIATCKNLSHALARIAKRAGLEWHADVHRHSYISHRIAKIKDIARVSEEVGTDSGTLRRKYRRPLPSGQATKYFGITPDDCATNVTEIPAQKETARQLATA